MSDDKEIHISKFDLNSRERLINTEHEVKYQRVEIDKLTELSADFAHKINHIESVIKSFAEFSKRSAKAVKNLESRYGELNRFYLESKETLEGMKEIKQELDDYLEHQKRILKESKPKEEKNTKSLAKRIKNLEKWQWTLMGGGAVLLWGISFVLNKIGITKLLMFIGLG